MSMIKAGSVAPDFSLESHALETIKLANYKGEHNVLLVFYPLDFTPT